MKSSPLRCFSCALILLLATPCFAAPAHRSTIELKNGAYYFDGHKFFVNALGYEPGARPGEHPYKQRVVNLDLLRQDLKNIKAAGFNSIRTWSDLTEDELKVVQASGLKIVFGVFTDVEHNFGDPKIAAENIEHVRRTLSFSKKYDCIITYLIMNEPMPAHLHEVGAQNALDFWTKIRDLIHQEHPGVPVTISGNTAITGWIDMNVFDVYGHNTYDYESEGSNYTHSYMNANRFVAEINAKGKPVLVTEFGRSVSRQGAGAGQYGGNTLEEQAAALVRDYRALLDSGVAGVCPFYYADGWWKGGEPALHNDTAEEWFGFWGYKSLEDKAGYPRPVWYALRQYNEAIVTSPRNHEFYQNEVPVEIFFQPDVKKFRIIHQDGLLLEASPDAHGFYNGKLSFATEGLKDRELVFESYDAQGRLLKVETIIVLTGKDPVQWPTIAVHTSVSDLEGTSEVPIEITVRNSSPFTVANRVRYSFAPHKGWEPGEARGKNIDPNAKEQTVSDSYKPTTETIVLGLYAGTDIRYGKFTRTIYTQRYLFRGNWADPIRLK